MFIPIVDWISTLISALNDTNILLKNKKNRKLANDFLKIYSCIDEIVHYGEDIMAVINDTLEHYRDTGELHGLTATKHVLYMQSKALAKLDGLFYRGGYYYYGLECIFNIYSSKDLGHLLRQSIHSKLTFINFLSNIFEYAEKERDLMLPKSFDLRGMLNKTNKYGYEFYEIKDYAKTKDRYVRISYDNPKSISHLKTFYEQLKEHNSLEKLRSSKQQLGQLIRDNFEISNLF